MRRSLFSVFSCCGDAKIQKKGKKRDKFKKLSRLFFLLLFSNTVLMEEPTAKTRQRRVSQPTYGTNSSEYPHGRQRRRSAAAPLRRRTTVRRPRQKISSSSSGSTPEQEEVIEEHDFTLKDKQEVCKLGFLEIHKKEIDKK